MHRQGGKFKGNAVPFQQNWCKVICVYIACKLEESRLKALSGIRVQAAEPPVRLAAGPERQFPGHQGGNSKVGVQQEAVQLHLRVHLRQLFPEALLRLLQERQAASGGRLLVKQTRQYLPGG